MRKILLNEEQFKRLIKLLKEQDESEYYKISPEDYIELITSASFNPKVFGIKKFGGKPLYITGNLNLNGLKDMYSLGNVAYIDGNLNINNTKIASIGNTKVKGNISDYGSEMERIRIRKEELKKLDDANERREDGEWDLDNPNIDDEGLMANALFQFLVSEGKLNEMDEDTKVELQTKQQRLKELQERYDNVDGVLEPEEVSPLADEIFDLEEEIEELQGDYADVYYIMPQSYSYGALYYFEVVGLRNQEYMVGSYDDAYDAAVKDQEQLLDDTGLENLPSWLIEDNIDKDDIRDEMREFYEDDIRNNPDIYFDEDDFELTDEEEERKEQLENYINEMEDLKSEKEDQRDEYEHNSDEYNELDEQIQEIESNIETAQEELDSIEPDTEPTDDMIDEKVDYYIRNTDEIDWLKEMGYELSSYVNMTDVAKDIVESDGIGVLARYDGRYEYETVKTADGKSHEFVVMRTN
jgi:chromosome segregation ATPase